MNIRKGIRKDFRHIFKEIEEQQDVKKQIFSFSFYSLKWQIEDDYFLQKMKDKTSTSSEPRPHG